MDGSHVLQNGMVEHQEASKRYGFHYSSNGIEHDSTKHVGYSSRLADDYQCINAMKDTLMTTCDNRYWWFETAEYPDLPKTGVQDKVV